MVIYRHNKGKENLQNQKGNKKMFTEYYDYDAWERNQERDYEDERDYDLEIDMMLED